MRAMHLAPKLFHKPPQLFDFGGQESYLAPQFLILCFQQPIFCSKAVDLSLKFSLSLAGHASSIGDFTAKK